SPSVMDDRPTDSWSATAARIAASSTGRSAARSISPRATRARASRSSGGRRRLPTWSARNGGRAVPLIGLPGESVCRTARIGPGRERAALRIAARHHRADAAGAGLRDGVAEGAELGPRALGDARLDVELTGFVGPRPERVDQRLGREARRLDGLLRVHPE